VKGFWRFSRRILAGLTSLLLVGAVPAIAAPLIPISVEHQTWGTQQSIDSQPFKAELHSLAKIFQQIFGTYRVSTEAICSNREYKIAEARSLLLFSSYRSSSIVEIHLLENKSVNAFALSTGSADNRTAQIIITTGLLKQITTPSEMAFVLAHEMGHILSRHISPTGYTGLFTQSQLSHIAEVHRGWEFEADIFAIERIKHAGFSSGAAHNLLNRLSSSAPASTVPDYLQRHPSSQLRVLTLQAVAESTNDSYLASK